MRGKIICSGIILMITQCVSSSQGADLCTASAKDNIETSALFKGTIIETTNVTRYTYVLLDDGNEKIWAAGPKVDLKVGDSVAVNANMPNKEFYSPTLKRKFDKLYFVDKIMRSDETCDKTTSTAQPTCPTLKSDDKVASKSSAVEIMLKPEGGKTVAEIWAEKANLTGKKVIVRAKVVKVTANVLGMNWLHLRDGSGGEGNNDLVVTTKADLKVGQIVTASGLISTDKDIGAGYRYDVIVENATVTIP